MWNKYGRYVLWEYDLHSQEANSCFHITPPIHYFSSWNNHQSTTDCYEVRRAGEIWVWIPSASPGSSFRSMPLVGGSFHGHISFSIFGTKNDVAVLWVPSLIWSHWGWRKSWAWHTGYNIRSEAPLSSSCVISKPGELDLIGVSQSMGMN